MNSRLNNTESLNAAYIFLNFNLSHFFYLLLLLDFFQIRLSASCQVGSEVKPTSTSLLLQSILMFKPLIPIFTLVAIFTYFSGKREYDIYCNFKM